MKNFLSTLSNIPLSSCKKYQTATGRIVYFHPLTNGVYSPHYKNDHTYLTPLFPSTPEQLEQMEASGSIRHTL